MYKFFLYFILMLAYLGLAKALSPSEIGVQYLQNEKGFSNLVKSPNATLILVDTHATGFLIKTYYQKYRMVAGFDIVEEIIVRTNREFAKRNLPNIGLSVYRRIDGNEEYLPLPPGSSFVGVHAYGDWHLNKTGKLVWSFHRPFKNFPRYLGWGKFRPDQEFFTELKSSISMGRPFYGIHEEFGPNGNITQKSFPHFFQNERMKKIDMKALMIEYLKENF
jgi:hypothetical protein